MRWTRLVWPAIIVASVIAVSVAVFGHSHSPLRPFVALWFLTICPGMALVHPLRIMGTRHELVLAIATSLALAAIVSSLLLYAHRWSPPFAVAVLVGISVVGVGRDVILSRREAATVTASARPGSPV